MADRLQFNVSGRHIPLLAEEVDATQGARPAILLLHGSGGHVDYWVDKLSPALAQAQIGLYAPHYFERTGTSRADLAKITDGYHVPRWIETIEEALRFVAARPAVDPQRIVLAGVSLGGFLSLALAAQLSAEQSSGKTRRIRALLDVSGGLVPPYDALATSAMPPTLVVHGEADTVVDVRFAREVTRRLRELGVVCDEEILPGEGHWFSAAAVPRILLAMSRFLQRELA